MEGFLPPLWAGFWYAFSLPIVAYGAYKVKKKIEEDPKVKSLLAVVFFLVLVVLFC